MSRTIKGISVFIILSTLVALFTLTLVSCARSPVAEYEEEKKSEETSLSFFMPNRCAGCHGMIYEQYRDTMHAFAFVDPLYWAEANLAGEEAGDEIRNWCHSCHAAAASMIEKIPADADQASQLAKAGIICDFCHSVTEVTGNGNVSFKLETATNTKRGPYKNSYSPFHLSEYSEIHTKAEFCAGCHDVYHPVNGLPIEQPYQEWKEGPYAEQGIVCQDCHMTPGPGVTKPNPGVVAAGGPEREHYFTHNPAGANVFMTRYLGHEELAKQAEERLKAAARLEISKTRREGNQAAVTVKVANVGAGHKLPTGLTVLRHMWIEFTVTDASGKVIYSSGVLDKEGNLPEDAHVFHTIFGDASGKPTDKVWEAEKILFDNRIPPGETAEEVFEFVLPSNSRPPYTIKARLLYRSAPQYLVNKLMEDKPEVPVIEMTSTQATF